MAFDLSPLRDRVTRRAETAVRLASARLETRIRSTSPLDTGLMRERSAVTASGTQAEVRVAVPYASYVREGTRPHRITARNAPVLSFFWARTGRQMFLPHVNHPGTKPQAWYDDALASWPDLLREALPDE